MALNFADIIIITTVATAHKEIAMNIAPFLKSEKIILLCPGKSFGAYEFRKTLDLLKVSSNIKVSHNGPVTAVIEAELT